MRSKPLPILFLTIALQTSTSGQVPVLLKDIDPESSSDPRSLACHNGVHYFTATTTENGRELWRTDGTQAGTYLVKDLFPGSASAYLSNPMVMGDHLYFIHSEGLSRFLWRTDGTEEGTQEMLRMADLEDSGLTNWNYFEVLGDRIFFAGGTPEHGRELWSTDGTAEGTELFMDIRAGSLGSSPEGLKSYMNKLYFTASLDAGGEKHWVTDGTVEGTLMLTDMPSLGGADPPNFFGVGDLVYFRFSTDLQGTELYVTDGTFEGTHLVRDLLPGPNSSIPQGFADFNGQLHFYAFTASTPNLKQIYQTDGTYEGTTVWPDLGLDRPDHGMINHNGYLYFTAYVGTIREIWRSDGTMEGTQAILHPQSEPQNHFQSGNSMCSCNGVFYFAARYMADVGGEFYVLDAPSSNSVAERSATRNAPYPNPATSMLMVSADHPSLARLLDNLGRDVRTWRLTTGINTVDLDGLSQGIYLLMTETGSHRIVKQ